MASSSSWYEVGDPEDVAEQRERPGGGDRAADRGRDRRPDELGETLEVLADEHRERHDHGDVDDRHRDRGLTELGEALAATARR